MRKLLFALALVLVSARAAAFGWPWQALPEERLLWCKGLIAGGLSSNQTAAVQRTDLWLAWSTLIRAGAADHSAAAEGYAAGRARFDGVANQAAVRALLDEARDDCGLGRFGRQITGW